MKNKIILVRTRAEETERMNEELHQAIRNLNAIIEALKEELSYKNNLTEHHEYIISNKDYIIDNQKLLIDRFLQRQRQLNSETIAISN